MNEANKEPNIDILLRDLCGDDGLKEYPIETKYTLAVLIFQMQRQFLKELDLTDNLNTWLAELDLPAMNAEAALKKLRDVGILNSTNRFKSSKDIDSGLTIMLFAHVIEGNMEVSMKNGNYAFKMTPQGNKMVEDMGIKFD